MEWSSEDAIGWFERVYSRTLEVAQAIPDEYWNYKPNDHEFSCADIVRHIASTELMNAGRLETGRLVYTGHSDKHGQTKAEAMLYLENCHKKAVELMQRLGDNGFTRLVPTNQGDIAGWRVLVGMIEHEIHHRSQLCSYLSQVGVTPPALYGIFVEDLPTQ